VPRKFFSSDGRRTDPRAASRIAGMQETNTEKHRAISVHNSANGMKQQPDPLPMTVKGNCASDFFREGAGCPEGVGVNGGRPPPLRMYVSFARAAARASGRRGVGDARRLCARQRHGRDSQFRCPGRKSRPGLLRGHHRCREKSRRFPPADFTAAAAEGRESMLFLLFYHAPLKPAGDASRRRPSPSWHSARFPTRQAGRTDS